MTLRRQTPGTKPRSSPSASASASPAGGSGSPTANADGDDARKQVGDGPGVAACGELATLHATLEELRDHLEPPVEHSSQHGPERLVATRFTKALPGQLTHPGLVEHAHDLGDRRTEIRCADPVSGSCIRFRVARVGAIGLSVEPAPQR